MPYRLALTLMIALMLALTMRPAPLAAQTGPELMLKPWGPPADTTEASGRAKPQLELAGNARYTREGEVEANNRDFQLTTYSVDGRYRLSTRRGAPAVGYDLVQLDLDTADPALPERLVDTAVSIGAGLGRWKDWELAGTIGGGFAGDLPFADDEGWYAKASVIGNKKLDEDRSLQVGLQYDGNRAIFPDIPLPLFSFSERVNDQLRYTLGLPYSTITWSPTDRFTLEASTITLFDFTVEGRYRVMQGLEAFAGYDSETTGFHLKGDDEHRRLFYEQRSLEAGLRYRPQFAQQARLILAGGYTLDREFSRGFDIRDDNTVREISDEPYVRAGLSLAF
jgi:hypothetical protein